jgi:hypothetical protein
MSSEKFDEGKPSLLRGVLHNFPRALRHVAFVSQYGVGKYGRDDILWHGWKSVPDGPIRYAEALVRHLAADGCDEESGYLHAAHAAWNALAVLELLLMEREKI